jgi:hypothetical protein
MNEGSESPQIKSPIDEAREILQTIPRPSLTPQTISDTLILDELVRFQETNPESYKTLKDAGASNSFLYRSVDPELKQLLEVHAPHILQEAQLHQSKLQNVRGLENFGQNELPINIRTNISLWRADYDLWLKLIHGPVHMYLDGIRNYMRDQTINANRLERQGLRDQAKSYDIKKTEAGKKLITESIDLGCPEVIHLTEGNHNLAIVGLIMDWHDEQNILSNSSHIPFRLIEPEARRLNKALESQKKILQNLEIDMPLFQQEAQFEPRSQRMKRES